MTKQTQTKQLSNGWKEIPLSEVLDYEQPNPYIVNSEILVEKTPIPVLTANKGFIKGYTKDTEKALRRFGRSLPIPFENQARKTIRYTPSEDEEPRKIGSTVLDELMTGERLYRMFLPGPSLKQKKERDLIEAFRLPKKSKLFSAEWFNDWLSERRERKIEEAQEELFK